MLRQRQALEKPNETWVENQGGLRGHHHGRFPRGTLIHSHPPHHAHAGAPVFVDIEAIDFDVGRD